jgi:hypothetical protein
LFSITWASADSQTSLDNAQAAHGEAQAELDRAQLKLKSEIGGVNTTVANIEAQLRLARYYLDNTTLKAPEDGRIINLQVRPDMVSGIYRIGGIAALIAEADRYLLATFNQESLKYVRPGRSVEVALDLYPGQIFAAKVDSIWRGNGEGQYLPSDEIPKFQQAAPNIPQGRYAVKILLDDMDQAKFPIGAQGAAARNSNYASRHASENVKNAADHGAFDPRKKSSSEQGLGTENPRFWRAGAPRREVGPRSPWTRIALPSPKSRRPNATASETCSRRNSRRCASLKRRYTSRKCRCAKP